MCYTAPFSQLATVTPRKGEQLYEVPRARARLGGVKAGG